jgi:beta-glucosidase
LPLEEEVLKNINKIALIGPFADEKAIIGGWAALGSNSDAISLKEGVEKKLAEIQKQTNKFIALSVVRGCGFLPEAKEGIENAIKAAEQADLVILAMGEPQGMSGEAKSRAFLDLPGGQLEMLKRIAELKKPAVGILFNGRPLILTEIHSLCNSLLEVWFPGTEGGNAVADVLFGEYNPSGKLPVSFPLSVGQIPIYYNHFRTGRPALDPDQPGGYNSHYLDSANSPLFPFGFGLSYTTFQYSNGKISSSQLKSGGAIQVEVTITNTGQYAGEEIVQLYIQDVVGSAIRPVKELKAFQKIRLDPGEAKTVIFKIEEPMLRFWNQRQEYRSEPGDFSAMIGPDSENLNEFYFRMG